MIIGKIVGFILGTFILHPPFGSLLGLYVGHLFDTGYFGRSLSRRSQQYRPGYSRPWQGFGAQQSRAQQRASVQQLFFDQTFSIMGYVAKADGRISEKEIQVAERVMSQMNLHGDKRTRAIDQFNLGKSIQFDMQKTLHNVRRTFSFQPGLLKSFLEIQVQVAMADGTLSPRTREALRRVYQGLGIPAAIFEQFERQFGAGYRYQQKNQRTYQDPAQKIKDAYAILELSSTASDSEVKKAYRKMMSKHHPDRLASKGVPPEMIKLANQKTQQVKEAYDAIKSSRGIK